MNSNSLQSSMDLEEMSDIARKSIETLSLAIDHRLRESHEDDGDIAPALRNFSYNDFDLERHIQQASTLLSNCQANYAEYKAIAERGIQFILNLEKELALAEIMQEDIKLGRLDQELNRANQSAERAKASIALYDHINNELEAQVQARSVGNPEHDGRAQDAREAVNNSLPDGINKGRAADHAMKFDHYVMRGERRLASASRSGNLIGRIANQSEFDINDKSRQYLRAARGLDRKRVAVKRNFYLNLQRVAEDRTTALNFTQRCDEIRLLYEHDFLHARQILGSISTGLSKVFGISVAPIPPRSKAGALHECIVWLRDIMDSMLRRSQVEQVVNFVVPGDACMVDGKNAGHDDKAIINFSIDADRFYPLGAPRMKSLSVFCRSEVSNIKRALAWPPAKGLFWHDDKKAYSEADQSHSGPIILGSVQSRSGNLASAPQLHRCLANVSPIGNWTLEFERFSGEESAFPIEDIEIEMLIVVMPIGQR